MMIFEKRLFNFNAALLLVGGVFVLDLVTTLGVAVWLLYVVPLLLVSGAKDRIRLLVTCALCSLLTFFVLYVRPEQEWTAETLLNRSMGIALYVVITLILVHRSRMSMQIEERNRELTDAYHSVEAEIARRRRTEEELRASRERLEGVMKYAAEAIYLVAPDETITYANPAFSQITGYEEKEIVGRKLSTLTAAGSESVYEDMWRRLRQGDAWSGYLASRKRDGTAYERDISISPVRGAAGSVVEYVAISRDVTRERRLEEQLRQSQKLQAIGTLAGGIAHDFNNILAAIIGFTELSLENVPSSNPARRYLSQIYDSAVRARDLVRQILTFSRRDGKEAGPVPFVPLIENALRLLRASIPANIRLSQNLPNGNDVILADPEELQQILIHLVTNAAQAMKQTGGTIEVTLAALTGDDEEPELPAVMRNRDYFRLSVRDTGPGIDADAVRKLYDPFFTTKRPEGGKGMGLPLVYGIVTRIGGAIQVTSTIGEGTSFVVYLPRNESRPSVVPHTAALASPGPLRHITVLFVDDEEMIAEVASHAFKKLGLEALVLTDPEKAFRAFAESPDRYDVVVLDQAMPGMTGVELARKILEIRSDVPVILCTGFSETISKEMARSLGIRDLLMKPLLREELTQAIQRAIDAK